MAVELGCVSVGFVVSVVVNRVVAVGSGVLLRVPVGVGVFVGVAVTVGVGVGLGVIHSTKILQTVPPVSS